MQLSSEHRPAPAGTPSAAGVLRWIADSYEQAQRIRIQTGERIRALVQARDRTGEADPPDYPDANALLRDIQKGASDGPVALLGRTYRRHFEAEREYVHAMKDALAAHPAWTWLSQVKGVGPTLAAKLLARLDIRRADTPSSFWSYCGLGTVPGVEYRCALCGLTASYPESYRVTGTHLRRGRKQPCDGRLERVRGPADGVRVAQPRPSRGERASYDQYAKKVCYLIGTSFLKAGGPYGDFYRQEKAKLEADRPGWSASRRHLAALRKAEKLFLSHLWLVWREAVGLPLTVPYAKLAFGYEIVGPWEMIGVRKPASAPPASTPQRPTHSREPARIETAPSETTSHQTPPGEAPPSPHSGRDVHRPARTEGRARRKEVHLS